MLNPQADYSVKPSAQANASTRTVDVTLTWGSLEFLVPHGGLALTMRITPEQAEELARQLRYAVWLLTPQPANGVVHGA